VNGAMGTVRGIVYENNLGQLPVVLVDFPSYTGPAFISSQPTVVPIAQVKRQGLKVWHQGAMVTVNRAQLPLQLASAITIHKSQGLTVGPGMHIERVIVDVGEGESWCEGLAYVAISRAMFMESFALDPMQPCSRWESIGKSKGAERTHLWLQRLELTAACQHVSTCGTNTSACRICQNIKLRQGAHVDHNLQSILTLKDMKL
jgi:ATP-dependent exoDNAse (exonuclease V) alpha subunit